MVAVGIAGIVRGTPGSWRRFRRFRTKLFVIDPKRVLVLNTCNATGGSTTRGNLSSKAYTGRQASR